MKTALLAVYTKDEQFLLFAKKLQALGWKLLASSGTAAFLNREGVPARDVAEIVGAPILGHRVVTLAREIYAGILSRDDEGDRAELSRINVEPIDLVCVTLYPLAEELAKPDHTEESAREKIDIGGPTLLRAAAKGQRIVVSDPSHYEIALGPAATWPEVRRSNPQRLAHLAFMAEQNVMKYCATTLSFYERVWTGRYLPA